MVGSVGSVVVRAGGARVNVFKSDGRRLQCVFRRRCCVRKIEIRTQSGITETGWIRSSKDFWYLDESGKEIRWIWAEGDTIEIKEDVDACEVPKEIIMAMQSPKGV